jgi:hypothetical protein
MSLLYKYPYSISAASRKGKLHTEGDRKPRKPLIMRKVSFGVQKTISL